MCFSLLSLSEISTATYLRQQKKKRKRSCLPWIFLKAAGTNVHRDISTILVGVVELCSEARALNVGWWLVDRVIVSFWETHKPMRWTGWETGLAAWGKIRNEQNRLRKAQWWQKIVHNTNLVPRALFPGLGDGKDSWRRGWYNTNWKIHWEKTLF